MDRLYIVRHGIAVDPGTPGIEDDQRPLTSKGKRRIREIGQGLRRCGVAVDRIITSPLPRARRTAEILAKVLADRDVMELADVLRSGTPAEEIRVWLSGRAEDRVMIVGHNPDLSRLVGLMVLGQPAPDLCELRQGGVAALVPPLQGGYRLDWLATPKQLRRCGR